MFCKPENSCLYISVRIIDTVQSSPLFPGDCILLIKGCILVKISWKGLYLTIFHGSYLMEGHCYCSKAESLPDSSIIRPAFSSIRSSSTATKIQYVRYTQNTQPLRRIPITMADHCDHLLQLESGVGDRRRLWRKFRWDNSTIQRKPPAMVTHRSIEYTRIREYQVILTCLGWQKQLQPQPQQTLMPLTTSFRCYFVLNSRMR